MTSFIIFGKVRAGKKTINLATLEFLQQGRDPGSMTPPGFPGLDSFAMSHVSVRSTNSGAFVENVSVALATR